MGSGRLVWGRRGRRDRAWPERGVHHDGEDRADDEQPPEGIERTDEGRRLPELGLESDGDQCQDDAGGEGGGTKAKTRRMFVGCRRWQRGGRDGVGHGAGRLNGRVAPTPDAAKDEGRIPWIMNPARGVGGVLATVSG